MHSVERKWTKDIRALSLSVPPGVCRNNAELLPGPRLSAWPQGAAEPPESSSGLPHAGRHWSVRWQRFLRTWCIGRSGLMILSKQPVDWSLYANMWLTLVLLLNSAVNMIHTRLDVVPRQIIAAFFSRCSLQTHQLVHVPEAKQKWYPKHQTEMYQFIFDYSFGCKSVTKVSYQNKHIIC